MNPVSDKSKNPLAVLDKAANKLEVLLVSLCLCAMIGIVLCQIFMRNAMDSGFVLGDSMVKHLVLWITFLGAGLAARKDSHIKIDIADRLLPFRIRRVVKTVVDLFSAFICGILVRASYSFLLMEKESQTTFGMSDIPVWYLESIIPIGFAIIALRFTINGLKNIVSSDSKN